MTLQERDKKHIWHPLKQHQTHPNSLGIVKAKGCILTDEHGNEYIDAISSWYTCMFGHCNDFITNRVYQQMQQLDQIMFSDFTHPAAVKLSEKLIQILPENQAKIFFNDNGSTAVESAIKMALQYYFNIGNKRTTFIAFENGFHGDTFGAMSTSGLSVYNGPFEDFLINIHRIPVPNGENHAEILEQLTEIIANNKIAAFVYEPIVQGAAGMKIHNIEGLNQIIEYCKNNDILTIADEVMTGFGKTGKNFASDHVATKPDIICLSKALTGGLVPMAITSCTQKIYDAFLSNDIAKGYFHCHTYSANPIGCAAAIASIDLLTSEEIQESIQRISKSHIAFSEKIKTHAKVKSTRSIGVIFALDLDTNMERYGTLRDLLLSAFMKEGVFLRPLGNTIYIQVPYVITDEQLEKIYNTIIHVLNTLL
ncbi:adenosylmethionine--8-amino-7-oxononanoate transaminase [uncultured Tenacibaculum sp.]|uniref:adenosylmethionine--8-amino-7-oxononanoate transaminase n=1 Tax=uncultured Tenacibaculum sp. TaxID=174713 RepID=UPI0026317C24|nr:adenosylmethionine--8-amino-7-oxononanoate transaminase [uncultured Tenacibaculum sp.]